MQWCRLFLQVKFVYSKLTFQVKCILFGFSVRFKIKLLWLRTNDKSFQKFILLIFLGGGVFWCMWFLLFAGITYPTIVLHPIWTTSDVRNKSARKQQEWLSEGDGSGYNLQEPKQNSDARAQNVFGLALQTRLQMALLLVLQDCWASQVLSEWISIYQPFLKVLF